MAGWSDYGFPNKIFLSPPLPILTGLAVALNERISAVYSPSEYAPVVAAPLPLSPWNSTTAKAWFNAFEVALNETLHKFANPYLIQPDYTGYNLDNGASAVENWTRQSIYDYLGETEIFYKDCILAPLLWSKYLLQKYRVINELYIYRPFNSVHARFHEMLSYSSWGGGPFPTIDQWHVSSVNKDDSTGDYYLIGKPYLMLPSKTGCKIDLYYRITNLNNVEGFVLGMTKVFSETVTSDLIIPPVNYAYPNNFVYQYPNYSPFTGLVPQLIPGEISFIECSTDGQNIAIIDYSVPNGFKFRGEDW